MKQERTAKSSLLASFIAHGLQYPNRVLTRFSLFFWTASKALSSKTSIFLPPSRSSSILLNMSHLEQLLSKISANSEKLRKRTDMNKYCVAQGPLRDPIFALPPELFSQLLSSLPPKELATSNAVSKSWRNLVLPNSSLHKEMDLSRLGAESRMEIIQTFQRVSALSFSQ